MERLRFRYRANYGNREDDLGCIIRKLGKIILLFFGFYEAHVLNLEVVEFLVKCNLMVGRKSSVAWNGGRWFVCYFIRQDLRDFQPQLNEIRSSLP